MTAPDDTPDRRPSPEEYQTFVRGLELVDVRLVGCDVSAQEAIDDPSRVVLDLDQHITFNVFDSGFEAVQEYQFYFLDHETDNELGQIEATFGFVYETDRATDAVDFESYLDVFSVVSLPVNVWPFAREFVHDMTMRLGWPRLDLPLLKPGMNEPDDESSAEVAANESDEG
jgi:hypothetical protein